MLPRVVIHNAVSADGRMDHLKPDLGLYYEVAGRFRHDAILTTTNTLLAEPLDMPAEDSAAFRPRAVDPRDTRPLLVVADGRGRLRNWHKRFRTPHSNRRLTIGSHGRGIIQRRTTGFERPLIGREHRHFPLIQC